MSTPTVVISVDCVCAAQGKCYVSEIVSVAEKYTIPLTWLLGVTEHDPMSNVKLYHNEYLHKIPAWHELGLYISFDTGPGNTVERGDLIRIGKDVLKSYSIKPSAFRAALGDIEESDLLALEDIGILVDSSTGSSSERPASAPKSPYHPDYEHLHKKGTSKIWEAPVANVGGAPGYIDAGFDKIKPLIDAALGESSILSLAMHDCVDNAVNLTHVVDYLKKQSARFVTMTQLITEQ